MSHLCNKVGTHHSKTVTVKMYWCLHNLMDCLNKMFSRNIGNTLCCDWLTDWLTVYLSILQVIICPPALSWWCSDLLTQLLNQPNINNFSHLIMDWNGTNVWHMTYHFSCRSWCFLWSMPKFMILDLTISTFCDHPLLYQFKQIGMGQHGWQIGFAYISYSCTQLSYSYTDQSQLCETLSFIK
jgi:hypothetical protein